ncbi:MAG: hypothetical protein HY673_26495 [Chloroflexi bacterium]|nr:hypothetical protein [Chloroflexota bacterium]
MKTNLSKGEKVLSVQKSPEKKESDELVRVIDEYKLRLEQLIQKETERQRLHAEEESNQIIAGASEKAEKIIADSQHKAQQTAAEIEQKAHKEAARLVGDAKFKAEQTLKDAEARIKKEARERTRKEVESIIKRAREEASGIENYARQQSEKDANELIAAAKQEAGRARSKAAEEAKQEAYQQSARIIAEYRAEMEKNAAAVAERVQEIDSVLNESVLRAESIFNKFKKEVHGELEETRKNIAESGRKLAEALAADAGPKGNPARLHTGWETDGTEDATGGKAGTIVDITATRTNGSGGQLFKGGMELRVIPPYNSAQIKELIHAILQVPGIKRAGDYGSDEEGAKVIFEIREPLPLVKVLNKMPLVASTSDKGDSIRLVLSP